MLEAVAAGSCTGAAKQLEVVVNWAAGGCKPAEAGVDMWVAVSSPGAHA